MDRSANSLNDNGQPICPECGTSIDAEDADMRSDGCFIHLVCLSDVRASAPFAA
jgi:hypothetical protein